MKALEILNRMTGMNEPERHELKLDGDERLKAIVDKSVLYTLSAGYRELHAKQGQLPTRALSDAAQRLT